MWDDQERMKSPERKLAGGRRQRSDGGDADDHDQEMPAQGFDFIWEGPELLASVGGGKGKSIEHTWVLLSRGIFQGQDRLSSCRPQRLT